MSRSREAALPFEVRILKASAINVGTLGEKDDLLSFKEICASAYRDIYFRLNLRRKELQVEFQLIIRNRRGKGSSNSEDTGRSSKDRDELFKLVIPFSQLNNIEESPLHDGRIAWFLTVKTPPKFFKKLVGPGKDESWFRQTDVVYNPQSLRTLPVTLKKSSPVLDIGRWLSYRFVFPPSKNHAMSVQEVRDLLRQHNIRILHSAPKRLLKEEDSQSVFDFIDQPSNPDPATENSFQHLWNDPRAKLPFQIRYQLEVCISHGYLNEYSMGQKFLDRLQNVETGFARDILEHVANSKKVVKNPMSIFDLQGIAGTTAAAPIPTYCVLIRSITVTPTTIYLHTPQAETSNRVIRQFSTYKDRFIRVRFSDELSAGKIYSSNQQTDNELYTRIMRTMKNGIDVGDRHYEFLAFGNSQFREHGAYFFASTADLSAQRIRSWMGHFRDIRVVAKHASRLGQCFSTTRAIGNVKVNVVESFDITRNGYTFTDGVGKISRFLADMIAEELGIRDAAFGSPSVFQFRLGGCKGILTVAADSSPLDIHIRPSQYKFPASHEGLEIVKWSRFATARLNRQLILVLSSLGVEDEVFHVKLEQQIRMLEMALADSKTALAMLQKYIDQYQFTLRIAGMILDGFQDAREPFVLSLLHLWRAWSIKFLKEKAQINIDGAAFLLGCVDETGILRGHYDSIQSLPSHASIELKAQCVPQVFVQISRDSNAPRSVRPKILTGPLLVARNPSLHPGDIRVVCGVDVPELHHIKDAIVFPQTGERDLPSMCSGGDLDGDDFVVIWDRALFPKEWNHEPMDYKAPKPAELDRDVTTEDLMTFFVVHMRSDNLPTIAHAHVAWSDYLDEGVKDERCVELARLHSTAVDFAKTGQPAYMPSELKPEKWPHFMEKKYVSKTRTYTSRKILGQLYDRVEKIDFQPILQAGFDRRILDAYDHTLETLDCARQIKREYDASMQRLMTQYDIKTEFEVFSTFVMAHTSLSNSYKFHEQIGELATALKDQYRALCIKTVETRELTDLAAFVAAMYTVTALDLQQHKPDGLVPAPFISFPWIFQDTLGQIAKRVVKSAPLPVYRAPVQNLQENIPIKPQKRPAKIRDKVNSTAPEIQTAGGTLHQGDLIELFDTDTHPRNDAVDNDENFQAERQQDMSLRVPGKNSFMPIDHLENSPAPVDTSTPSNIDGHLQISNDLHKHLQNAFPGKRLERSSKEHDAVSEPIESLGSAISSSEWNQESQDGEISRSHTIARPERHLVDENLAEHRSTNVSPASEGTESDGDSIDRAMNDYVKQHASAAEESQDVESDAGDRSDVALDQDVEAESESMLTYRDAIKELLTKGADEISPPSPEDRAPAHPNHSNQSTADLLDLGDEVVFEDVVVTPAVGGSLDQRLAKFDLEDVSDAGSE